MPILAVDTATEWQSVAVAEGDDVLGEVRLRAPSGLHSRRLMPSIAFLLDVLGLSPRALQGLAVTVGPGSFTGLRVGISAVQGLGLAGGLPCLALSTLDVLARRARGAAPTVAATVDAYRGQIYAALYDSEGLRVSEPRADSPAELVARLPDEVALVGSGAAKHRAELEAARPRAIFVPGGYLAGTLARMAAPRLLAGEGVPAAALRPQYLRDADVGPCRPS